MKRFGFALLVLALLPAALSAQQNEAAAAAPAKFALVIGNANYSGLTPLANPVNDANDISAVLEYLGFTVDKVLNGSMTQMEDAVLRLRDRLSASDNSYGFFFYAGHGVQSGGENFLIPVDANIPGENYLRNRAVSVQSLLDDLNDARNGLNVVVLDACRDNPFGWSRSGTRGLAIVSRQPADSIIVYATSAGQRASDGEGRNGLFTSQLLNNLATPGLEVSEVFKRTGADVATISNNQQIPAIYSQFFKSAYLGEMPGDGLAAEYVPGSSRPVQMPLPSRPARKELTPDEAAKLWSVGASVGSAFSVPRLTGAVRGTLAPIRNLFIEPGFEMGFISKNMDVVYYHLFPYVHAAYYFPFNSNGIYAGVGGGYLIGKYNFPEGEYSVNTFAVDIVVGGNILSIIDISYTFRTDFSNSGHKVSLGYIYRFK